MNVCWMIRWDTEPKMKTWNSSQEDVDVLEDVGIGVGSSLVVHNDNYNTFAWVIQCFIEILGHLQTQAEQCALIIHTKGKCQVKSGDFEEMYNLKSALIDRGLNATVE